MGDRTSRRTKNAFVDDVILLKFLLIFQITN